MPYLLPFAVVGGTFLAGRVALQPRRPNRLIHALTNQQPVRNTWAQFEETKLNPYLDRIYATTSAALQPYLPRQGENTRRRQLVALIGLEAQATDSAEERFANRAIVVAVAALTINTIGKLLYPPLMLLSIPLILRNAWPVGMEAYRQWVEERKIQTALQDTLFFVGIFAVRAFWTAALFDLLLAGSLKIQAKTRDQMQKSLRNILGDMPKFVWIENDGCAVTLPIEQVQQGDQIRVHAGEVIPVDGLIIQGGTTVDQQMLTGEARPIEKTVGDWAYAGTIVLAGTMVLRVEHAGAATVAGQVGEILRQTADYRSTLELRGQIIADRSALPTLALATATLAVLGPSSATALLACTVGYQLRYTGPLSVLSFLALATEHGVLIKDGRALEQLTEIDTVVFDKTGTLTQEQPQVAQIHTLPGFTVAEVLTQAAAAESKQSHPIARAILAAAQQHQLLLPSSQATTYKIGYGLTVMIGERLVRVGSARFMQQAGIALPPSISAVQGACQAQGHMLVYVAIDEQVAGALELHTTIRAETLPLIRALKQQGLSLYIISGDHEQPTRQLAQQVGIDHYFAEVLPAEKANLIEQLQAQGKKVCFVGDGINDAIALKKANVSISLRGATTMALDTAQIILRDESLHALLPLFLLAKQFRANMQVNLLAGTLPGLLNLAGIYLLHFNILAAALLAWGGLTIGMTNALLPRLQEKRPTNPTGTH